ncbi:MAG: type I secretion C-terminal target domain-containing protein [Alphaproteobacteria bacterium]|nr:type I secretion C-terminal target domain-containing protein [Alphaproteobacteria bacterium]
MTRITVNDRNFDFSLGRLDVNVLASAGVIAGAPPASGFFLTLDEVEMYFAFAGRDFTYDDPNALPTGGLIESITLRSGANGVNQLAVIEGLGIAMADFLGFLADPVNGNALLQAALRAQPWLALGNDGADTFEGSAGADTLTGGRGNDVYVVDHLGDRITERSGEGKDRVVTSLASYTLGANLEDLTFTGSGAFTGLGNSLNNAIEGSYTLGVLNGRAGTDTLVGGGGDDIYFVTDAGDVVVELENGGNDTVLTTLDTYMLDEQVEGLAFIGEGNFAGTGNGSANVISGDGGNDTLDGGAGADTLRGGAGDDVYIVGDAGDVVVELENGGNDTVLTTLDTYTLGDHIEHLSFLGEGNFAGTGNGLANVIFGGEGADIIDGGNGNDRVEAGLGADSVFGSNGADTLLGQDGNDTLLGGNGRDLLEGGADADLLEGGAGADTLDGGTGNDTLIGGLGPDILTGGEGADIFRYLNRGEGGDRITDFNAAEDILDLSALVTGAGLGGLDYQALFDAGRIQFATDRAGNVVVRFDANGTASGGLVTIATLEGVTDSATLGAGNFILETAPPAPPLLTGGEEQLC